MIDGQLVYFNSADVYKVIAVGYADADDELIVEEINEAIEKVDPYANKVTPENGATNPADPFSGLSANFDEGE